MAVSGRLPPLVERYLTWALPSGHDLAVAEASRYLAELPWAPYVLGTNPELRWREVGEHAVEVWAAMSGQQPTVRIEFEQPVRPVAWRAAESGRRRLGSNPRGR
jgi:hypothetical protein